MKKHHFARTMIAPVFYNSMMDIAYGFPGQAYLNARKRIDVFALVIVCILSGATDILEGLETQNVLYAKMFVDLCPLFGCFLPPRPV